MFFLIIYFLSLLLIIPLVILGIRIDYVHKNHKRKYIYYLLLFPAIYLGVTGYLKFFLIGDQGHYTDLSFYGHLVVYPLSAWILARLLKQKTRWWLITIMLISTVLFYNPVGIGLYYFFLFSVFIYEFTVNFKPIFGIKVDNRAKYKSPNRSYILNKYLSSPKAIILTILILIPFTWFMIDTKDVVGGKYISNYESKFLGQTHKSKKALLYRKFGDDSRCKDSDCTRMAENSIMELTSSCVGCPTPNTRYDRLFDMEIIPKGTKFKVVDSYMSESTTFLYRLFNPPVEMLIIEDQSGNRAKISEIGYEVEVVKEIDNKDDKKRRKKILSNISKIDQEGHLTRWYCEPYTPSKSKKDKQYVRRRPFNHNDLIEIKLLLIKKSFNLGTNFEISRLAQINRTPDHEDKRKLHNCAAVKFSSQNSYLITQRYCAPWGVAEDVFDEFHYSNNQRKICRTNIDDRKRCFDIIEETEFSLSKPVPNFTKNDALNYSRQSLQ